MSLLTNVEDKRHFPVPEGKEFKLDPVTMGGETGEETTLRTLDDLSEAINLIDPETFRKHVGKDELGNDKNDFANWVEYVFEETELASQLRKFPTPLRMMVSIEKFLR